MVNIIPQRNPLIFILPVEQHLIGTNLWRFNHYNYRSLTLRFYSDDANQNNGEYRAAGFTFELRDNGQYGFLLPPDQVRLYNNSIAIASSYIPNSPSIVFALLFTEQKFAQILKHSGKKL